MKLKSLSLSLDSLHAGRGGVRECKAADAGSVGNRAR